MAECECLGGCIFFNDKMSDMPVTANMYKKTYCLENSQQCARYMIVKTLGKSKVPANLFPNQVEKARKIIEQG